MRAPHVRRSVACGLAIARRRRRRAAEDAHLRRALCPRAEHGRGRRCRDPRAGTRAGLRHGRRFVAPAHRTLLHKRLTRPRLRDGRFPLDSEAPRSRHETAEFVPTRYRPLVCSQRVPTTTAAGRLSFTPASESQTTAAAQMSGSPQKGNGRVALLLCPAEGGAGRRSPGTGTARPERASDRRGRLPVSAPSGRPTVTDPPEQLRARRAATPAWVSRLRHLSPDHHPRSRAPASRLRIGRSIVRPG